MDPNPMLPVSEVLLQWQETKLCPESPLDAQAPCPQLPPPGRPRAQQVSPKGCF